MNTCDTCKWWNKFEEKTRSGLCTNEHMEAVDHVRLYEVGGELHEDWETVPLEDKHRANLIDSFYRASSPASAYSTDGRDIFGIETGPKFGCVHHQPK